MLVGPWRFRNQSPSIAIAAAPVSTNTFECQLKFLKPQPVFRRRFCSIAAEASGCTAISHRSAGATGTIVFRHGHKTDLAAVLRAGSTRYRLEDARKLPAHKAIGGYGRNCRPNRQGLADLARRLLVDRQRWMPLLVAATRL